MDHLTKQPACRPRHEPDQGQEMTDDETGQKYRRYCCRHCKLWLGDRQPYEAF